ncbi:PRC-barrel domain-containing protein [Microvirga sp. ACRRW]|uniref:PRC-barrel domain-containing protein n=1 Tax=Microvirga sp. ACRRW TaxID=2918205 RepID=UPI001EF60E70|nr:PRC-barrel domain-containing protein [Microvirga sp. ACRRW]MCG7391400.1 PRC-barrel domain-containing protein [Microvirga sp. ACRRW]
MKTLLMAGMLGSTLLATGAMAQSTPTTGTQPAPAANFMTQLPAGSMLLSDFMDLDVHGADNNDIGDVEDVILDRNGQVAGVVIEVEEGIGDHTVALPMTAFQMMPDTQTTGSVQGQNTNANRVDEMRLMLNMPVDQLKAAPEFDDND